MRLIFLTALTLATLSLQAQERTAVTLEQATREALDHNLNLIAERHRVGVAAARIITASLRPNPVLSLSADHLDALGTHFNEVNGAGPSEYAARTDFLLERGGKRENRIAVAVAERSSAELLVLNSVRTLLFDVHSAFVDIQLAKEVLTLAQENLKALNSIVEVNNARVRAGEIAQVELVRSRVAALQFQTAVQQANLRLRQAKNRLQFLMGRIVPTENFDVAGDIRREPAPFDFAGFRETSLRIRPDLLEAQRTQARSQADLRLQIAQGKVDYTVGAEYRRQQGVNGTGNSLGFFLAVPIPVFNKNQGEIERARREGEQFAAHMKALRSSIENEVANAFQQYSTQKDLLESIERGVLEQAREVRKTTEYSYRRGEASLIEFLDAQRAFNDAIQSYNEARAEYARSLFLIDSVSGRLVNP